MNVLGIDIGGTGIKGAPVDVEHGVLLSERCRRDTPKPATPKSVAKTVARVAKEFDWTGPIGCTLPARVQHGLVRTAANIDKAWIDTPVEELLSDATGCPVRVLNDADAAGVAAMAFGSGKGRRDLVVLLTVGTGIGSAVFIEGHLVPNTELGHLSLKGDSAEKYCADSVRRVEKLTWAQWARRFQRYLDLVEFLFAPDLIILGGGISRPSKVEQYFHHLKTEAELIPSVLENEAGIIGAAWAARSLVGGGNV